MSRADDLIAEQIKIELRKLNSIMTDEEDKPAIIQRIAELKAMLDTPSAKKETKPSKKLADVLSEAIHAWRYR